MANKAIYQNIYATQPGAAKKMSIPSTNAGTLSNVVEATRFFDAIKQNLDVITGRGSGVDELPTLPDNAQLIDVIHLINNIVRQLNASGE